MTRSGLAFHIHDRILLEFCFDYDARVQYIKAYKPADEQELRLRLLKLIPEDEIPTDLKKAYTDYQKAIANWEKAYTDYQKAIANWEKAYANGEKAYTDYQKAIANWEKAPAVLSLHAKLCPDCPWDGHTIFTRKDKDGNWY